MAPSHCSWSRCRTKPPPSRHPRQPPHSRTWCLPGLSLSSLHFILQGLAAKLELLLAVMLLRWLPSENVEATRPGNGYSQHRSSIKPPCATDQSHDMVFPDSRRWGERLYLLKSMRQCQRHSTRGVYGTGNITVNIFEKIQSTTTYYLKKKKKTHIPP